MSFTKFRTKDEINEDNKQADVIKLLERCLELAKEHKYTTCVVLLHKPEYSDTLGTRIDDFYRFMGVYTQLEYNLRQGAEEEYSGAA